MNLVSAKREHVSYTADFKSVVRAMGLVFGDIGTSPIYTMTVIFLLLPSTLENILGVVSLIIWTLVLIVFGQYILLAMRVDHFGEGGVLVLRHFIVKYIKQKGKNVMFFSVLGYIGAALLLGDGVITPSISILSAVEGIRLVSFFSSISTHTIVIISVIIAFILFLFQSQGSDRIALAFGPIMAIWFISLAVTGLISVIEIPAILQAINPLCAIRFCISHGFTTFLILAQIILCATGAEALYADIGHIGKKPIIRAWMFVFMALLLSYLGQGAFLLHKPQSTVLLFEMVHHQSRLGYIPFLILSILATVIASQSLISGAFSIIYQAIMMHKLPQMKISFTSTKMKSQIYIGVINWSLMISVVFMMLHFQKSENLASAYGLAVTGTIMISAFLMGIIFYYKRNLWCCIACIPLFLIDACFFISCVTKLPSGGYWSLIIAAIPLLLIAIWTKGEAKMKQVKQTLPLNSFLDQYREVYHTKPRIPGVALYSISDYHNVSPYVVNNMLRQGIVYETNILMSIFITSEPFGYMSTETQQLADGLFHFDIYLGYMDLQCDLRSRIEEKGFDPRVIFYPVDRIRTSSLRWIPYAMAKRLSPAYTTYFTSSIPVTKIHGVLLHSSFD